MKNNEDDLSGLWLDAKSNLDGKIPNPDFLIARAEKNRHESFMSHVWTIVILATTLLAISAFFFQVVDFQEPLSRIGSVTMMLVLVTRILIEILSGYRLFSIDLSQPVLAATDSALKYHGLRKHIQGPVSLIIVLLYTVGFYMLTPEFSKHLSFPMLLLIDGSYIVGAVLLTWQIRRGIRREMEALEELVDTKMKMMS